MTMTLRDVKVGMCWRFTSNTAPDHRPTFAYDGNDGASDLPKGWDLYSIISNDDEGRTGFWKENKDEPVQLLMHYEKAPEGKPLEDYEAMPACDVRAGQRFIGGPWNASTARAVAASLNRLEVSPKKYRAYDGPSCDNGWAVVCRAPAVVPVNLSIEALRTQQVDGLTGSECLLRYEYAQANEQLVRTPGGFVSTHGEFGLNEAQVARAQELWPLVLRAISRDYATAEAEHAANVRPQVVCDDIDEMPNMTYVKERT